MEHPGVRRLHPDESHFVVFTSRDVKSIHDDVRSLINRLGAASSSSQGLPHVITSFSSFCGSDNTIYILLDDVNQKAVGFIKVGRRHLFLWDRAGAQHEITGLCLLDFFTMPECQRRGYGKRMIDRILHDNGLEMRQIPIDRPSSLCLAFMKKHFGLEEFFPQANSFVVFDEFWEDEAKPMALLKQSRIRPKLITPATLTRTQQRRQQVNPITWGVVQ
jgi:alpha-tubulin N-acetyltransferase 1